jgi:hypothetical protein
VVVSGSSRIRFWRVLRSPRALRESLCPEAAARDQASASRLWLLHTNCDREHAGDQVVSRSIAQAAAVSLMFVGCRPPRLIAGALAAGCDRWYVMLISERKLRLS